MGRKSAFSVRISAMIIASVIAVFNHGALLHMHMSSALGRAVDGYIVLIHYRSKIMDTPFAQWPALMNLNVGYGKLLFAGLDSPSSFMRCLYEDSIHGAYMSKAWKGIGIIGRHRMRRSVGMLASVTKHGSSLKIPVWIVQKGAVSCHFHTFLAVVSAVLGLWADGG